MLCLKLIILSPIAFQLEFQFCCAGGRACMRDYFLCVVWHHILSLNWISRWYFYYFAYQFVGLACKYVKYMLISVCRYTILYEPRVNQRRTVSRAGFLKLFALEQLCIKGHLFLFLIVFIVYMTAFYNFFTVGRQLNTQLVVQQSVLKPTLE